MPALGALQSWCCRHSPARLHAAQVGMEQLQSMTSIAGSMTVDIASMVSITLKIQI